MGASVRNKEHERPALEAQGVYKEKTLGNTAGETVSVKRTFRGEVQLQVRVSGIVPEGLLEGLGRDRK